MITIHSVLTGRRIPFLFLSGYGQNASPADHPDRRVRCKPFRELELTHMLSAPLALSPAPDRRWR